MTITYTQGQDGLKYPNLSLAEEEQPQLGAMGEACKQFMIENKPQVLSKWVMTGVIYQKMKKINSKMEAQKEEMIEKLLEKHPIPETDRQQEQAAHMTRIYNQAEEIVLNTYLT